MSAAADASREKGYDVAAVPTAQAEVPEKRKNTQRETLPDDARTARRGSDGTDDGSVKSSGSKSSSAAGSAGQRASSRGKSREKRTDDANANSGTGGERRGRRGQKTAEEVEAEQKLKEGLQLIKETFAEATKGSKEQGDKAASSAAAAKATAEKKGGLFGARSAKAAASKAANAAKGTSDDAETEGATKANKNGAMNIPDTFEGMIRFNAGMTGANSGYIEIMLRAFAGLVSDVCSVGTLQEQTDFIALEIRKDVTGEYKTNEFRPCLMASMAALIPKRWNKNCEEAWGWFWESVETQLQDSLQQAAVHEARVRNFVKGLTEKDLEQLGLSLWKKLFKQEKEAELRHKQPTSTFVRIAIFAIQFSAQIFESPHRMRDEIQQHALKHILHQVEIRLFAVFVVLMEEEIRAHSKDEAITAGMNWALSVIASLMARTVKQTANPVLVAAVKDDVKGLMKALEAQPRSARTPSMLTI